MREKKNGIYASVFCATQTKFVCVSSGVLSPLYHQKVDHAELFTKAGQTAVSTERVAHFFDEIRISSPSPINAKHRLLFQTNNTNIADCVEARSNYGFILLYDAVVENRDNTIPIMHETDDHYHSTSDNIDTQRLYTRSTFVFSRRSLRDMTVTPLLHNKPNTDELTANLSVT